MKAIRTGTLRNLAAVFGLAALAALNVSCGDVNAQAQPDLAVGSWYGYAVPQNPATAPFPEVFMMPTFMADGTMIATDSHELTNPHTAAHGAWIRTSPTTIAATFVWINLTATAPNGFAGTIKVQLEGQLAPGSPDSMTGTVSPVFYPPPANPLDPNAQGIPLGTFNIASLQRIQAR
jgi:hypothetical protein